MVLGLVMGKLGNRGHDSKSISCEEDHLGSVSCLRHRLNNIINVINGVRNTGVLGFGCIIKIHFTVCCHDHILQECIPANGIEDIRFTLLAQVNGLGITTTFEIKDAIVIPSMLIIANKGPLGIGRQGSLSCS